MTLLDFVLCSDKCPGKFRVAEAGEIEDDIVSPVLQNTEPRRHTTKAPTINIPVPSRDNDDVTEFGRVHLFYNRYVRALIAVTILSSQL
jgi:hypothetical protein